MNAFAISLLVLLALDLIFGLITMGGGSRPTKSITCAKKGVYMIIDALIYIALLCGALGYFE